MKSKYAKYGLRGPAMAFDALIEVIIEHYTDMAKSIIDFFCGDATKDQRNHGDRIPHENVRQQ